LRKATISTLAVATMAASCSDGVGAASANAASSIRDLSARFANKVQIHLHPATSLPPWIAVDSDVGSLGVALIWTVDSLRLLRSYGLTGSFTGTLAQFPQQNIFLGLPVQLLPEEVVYLVRRGLGVVVDESASYRPSTALERGEVDARTEEDRRGQQLAAWYERQTLRAKHSRTPPASDPVAGELDGLPWHYTIPTTSTDLGWYNPVTYTTLSALHRLWPFPATERQTASVALFEHLVADRGLWCMNGLRFGGAFAVYPGDPLRYHSHYTAQLVLPSESVPMTTLVANGRLGTAVKKTHLLCCTTFEAELDPANTVELLRSGRFDTAPSSDKEQQSKHGRLARFDVFSLAWAGFGT
jgi:tRNA-splicing endonuclease subunit Sen34